MADEGFQFDGVKYEMGSLMLAEARAIQRATNMTPIQWERAINEGDAEAITALIWIARRRHGETNLRFEDVDGDLATFRPYLHDDEEEAIEAAVEEPGKADEALTHAGAHAAVDLTPSVSTTPAESGSYTE